LSWRCGFSSPWPTLDVRYRDPAYAAEGAVAERGNSPTVSKELEAEVRGHKAKGSGVALVSDLRRRFSDFKPETWNLELFFRPGVATAVVSLILIALAAVYFYRRLPAPPIKLERLDSKRKLKLTRILQARGQFILSKLGLGE
jgi:hypothetical protein